MNDFKETPTDSWETPQWLFDELDKEFDFLIDLCATQHNSKCTIYGSDYLKKCNKLYEFSQLLPDGYTCFMNPPYSNPLTFVTKAWEDSKYCTIVCLLPAKTDTKWWRVFWDSATHKPREGCEVRFMPYARHHPSRVAFVNPETGKPVSGNPCGSVVVIMDRREYESS